MVSAVLKVEVVVGVGVMGDDSVGEGALLRVVEVIDVVFVGAA